MEDGELIVRNQDAQKQDINQLSRDTENANNPLGQLFDKQKELDRMEAIELVKDIAAQAKDITNKYDRIEAQNKLDEKEIKDKAKKYYDGLPDKDKQELSKNGINSADDYANKEYYKDVNDQVIKNKKTNLGGMGSSVSKGIDAATSVVTGLITGDITGGLAGASAPYLAEQIKKATTTYDANGKEIVNTQANLIAHAILGAAVAQLQGNSALAGGAGAAIGEKAADLIYEALYSDTPKNKLSEAQKENISA